MWYNKYMELKEIYLNICSTFNKNVDKAIVITSIFDEKIIIIGNIRYQCIYKKWINQISISKLKELIMQDQILLADYINHQLGERLKEASIQYMDCAGNVFIKKPFIYIQGCKSRVELINHQIGKAFNLSGIKVLFLFLWNVKWVNKSYREISKVSGVSLGSIRTIMLNLQKSGYLTEFEGTRHLLNKKNLLKRWVYGYAEKLKPKLSLGVFSGEVEKIKSSSLLQYDCLIGSELVTLKEKLFDSQKISIYSDSLPIDFMKEFRLNRMSNGEIEIFKVPWNWKVIESSELKEIPKILVYADLMCSNEPRSIEVAEIIYDRYLAEYIENN